MNVHGRERKRAGNNGVFSYSKANDIFRRNPNPPPISSPSTLKSPDQNKLCKYWMAGHCHRGDKCWYLHSWSLGDGFTMLAKLEGHKKALNIHSDLELNLKGPVGQNGGIIAWRASCETDSFQLAASLEGHNGAVSCLAVGDKMLFSGSLDKTIRVWDIDTFQCIKTFSGHADVVTSLVHCNGYLFSSSLDCTIKVLFATEGQNWVVLYTHKEENGVLILCGMNDAETKPVLFCSYNDDTVRLYDLPSFCERGRIFSKREVRVIERGPKNLFFTGDASGSLTVWKWRQNPQGSS
ncbi:hypothetical protein GOBAR_AA20711 [Gossypium barbadense]|uniref:C3H1-type domain-containing protein n=1 Tax=Gossypium barbadense TaxID=3634 RepID=A0A2P5X9E4_GOSBA|nr:hypothetical protein GOBAR_AA20711 [Gossypium barbadense]